MSQICGNSLGICIFLGHIYGSGAVCEYSIWVTHTVKLLSDSGDVLLQCKSLWMWCSEAMVQFSRRLDTTVQCGPNASLLTAQELLLLRCSQSISRSDTEIS